MKLWHTYYHGPREAIRVLNRNPLNLYVGTTALSQHKTTEEAVLAAQDHADAADLTAIYSIKVDGGNYLRFEVMPRADVTIRFSQGTPINVFLDGAAIAGIASAVSAQQEIGNDLSVDIVGAAIAGDAGGIAIPYFLTIPSITVGIGTTHDMSQYLVDPTGFVGDNTVINGLAGFATYDPVTRLLTGVSVGVESGLTMEEVDP